jgi:antitoxin component YwqK of YwqJK toxin-antitoxin module
VSNNLTKTIFKIFFVSIFFFSCETESYKFFNKTKCVKNSYDTIIRRTKNDICYFIRKNDTLNGEFQCYFKDRPNVIHKKGFYKNGKLNGDYFIFDKNGNLKQKVSYKNDSLVGFLYNFNEKGNIVGKYEWINTSNFIQTNNGNINRTNRIWEYADSTMKVVTTGTITYKIHNSNDSIKFTLLDLETGSDSAFIIFFKKGKTAYENALPLKKESKYLSTICFPADTFQKNIIKGTITINLNENSMRSLYFKYNIDKDSIINW